MYGQKSISSSTTTKMKVYEISVQSNTSQCFQFVFVWSPLQKFTTFLFLVIICSNLSGLDYFIAIWTLVKPVFLFGAGYKVSQSKLKFTGSRHKYLRTIRGDVFVLLSLIPGRSNHFIGGHLKRPSGCKQGLDSS